MTYTIAIEIGSNGNAIERKVEASSDDEARRLAWESLTPEQRDATACMEIVEIK